ncbi:VOC family protein [Chloroflexota bacterium]
MSEQKQGITSELHRGKWAQPGSVMDDLDCIEVSIAVPNLQKTMGELKEYLGMVPYYVSDVIHAQDNVLYGKPNPGPYIKLAMYQTGPASSPGALRFELLEPCGGNSVYQEFLDTKGIGVNHIGFRPRNGRSQDDRIKWLESRGMPHICRQPSSAFSGWHSNAYYDTLEMLGFWWETVDPREYSEEEKKAALEAKGSQRVFAELHLGDWGQPGSIMDDLEMMEISIAVWDMEKTMKQLKDCFNMVPYFVSPVYEMPDNIYRGKPNSGSKIRIAFYQTGLASKPGPIRFELLQPCGGKSVYQDSLDLKGQGVTHLGFKPRNGKSQDERIKWAEARGMTIATRQPSSALSGWVDNVYYDTLQMLGFFIETVEPRKDT